MKQYFFAFLLMFSVMALASCSKGDDSDPAPGPGPTPPPSEPYFTAEVSDTCGFGCQTGSLSFIVDTNLELAQWSVTADAAWCRPSKAPFEFSIDLDAYEAESVAPRECRVTVKAGTLYSKTFLVRQESRTVIRGLPDVTIPLELSADGESVELQLYHNCLEIRALSTASWLSVSLKDNHVLTVTTSPRPAGQAPRSAEVQVTSAHSEGIYRFTVKDADATLDPEDFYYGEPSDWD